jgi:hypothetical protein
MLKKQMFIVSECLMRLGYRQLALKAQRSFYWEFVHDFVALIVRESNRRQDSVTLNRMATAGLISKRIAS